MTSSSLSSLKASFLVLGGGVVVVVDCVAAWVAHWARAGDTPLSDDDDVLVRLGEDDVFDLLSGFLFFAANSSSASTFLKRDPFLTLPKRAELVNENFGRW